MQQTQKKCLMAGCKHTSDQGEFVGNICVPCYEKKQFKGKGKKFAPDDEAFIGKVAPMEPNAGPQHANKIANNNEILFLVGLHVDGRILEFAAEDRHTYVLKTLKSLQDRGFLIGLDTKLGRSFNMKEKMIQEVCYEYNDLNEKEDPIKLVVYTADTTDKTQALLNGFRNISVKEKYTYQLEE